MIAFVESAIGLAFAFLAVSLICSGIAESVANILNKRASFLLRGLRQLLDGSRDSKLERQALIRTEAQGANDDASQATAEVKAATGLQPSEEIPLPPGGLTEALFGHVLIRVLKRPSFFLRDRVHNPSYVSAVTISQSLLDMLLPSNETKTIPAFIAAVSRLPEGLPAREALLALARDAGESIEALRTSIERWYDEQMSRVAGWYKRWAKKLVIIVALIVAASANIDAIAIGKSLYHDEPLRKAMLADIDTSCLTPPMADPTPNPTPDLAPTADCLRMHADTMTELELPIGWAKQNQPHTFTEWLLKVLGWILVAAAASLGAPFWFDALGRLGSWRNTGPKPEPAD